MDKAIEKHLDQNFEIDSKVIPKKDIIKVLSWIHPVISSAKRFLLDTDPRIGDNFLQNYPNEFCYKFNRRHFDNLFDRLLVGAVSNRCNYLWEPYG